LDIERMRAADPRRFEMANAIRLLAMDAVQAAKSGHPGMPMGMADVAAVLFDGHLKYDAEDAAWHDRDRFVLSAGHGSMLLYAVLHLTGHAEMTLDEIRNFRQLGSRTAGHPERGEVKGLETTTGPLGQGLGNAVGLAISERSLGARFGPKIVDHRTWVIAGDGCLMEGISQESITLAGHLRLNKLIVLWDNNGITIDGKIELADSTDQIARFRAAGWETIEVDGHDTAAVDEALTAARRAERPVLVACRTVIGFGAPSKQGTAATHGSPLGPDEVAAARKKLGIAGGAFEVSEVARAAWVEAGRRGREARREWEERLAALPRPRRDEFRRIMAGEAPRRLGSAIRKLKKQLAAEAPSVATRKASEMALAVINPVMPETIGGSADLTGSNNTRAGGIEPFTAEAPRGRYIYYGIREHGMAAAMNGMAIHGGVVPYGGTFLCFADYCRPAIRLSALMGVRVIYVMTHDSIGLGEDGPTHQPVEHLAMLRATPGLRVLRPADAVETAEAWELALTHDGPSVLALTRQNLPTVRTRHSNANLTARGAYVLVEAEGRRQAILLATGSEVEIALKAREMLEADGIGTRVVSMPSWELFDAQDEAYRRRVLPAGPVRLGIEAAVRHGWERWLCGERGREAKAAFIGMSGFGASAPYQDLYGHFGITPEAVATKAKTLI
jgi:transketolase